MRRRAGLDTPSIWLAVLVAAVAGLVLTGCSSTGSPEPDGAPRIGGPTQRVTPLPAEPMDRLERPVADRLAPRLRDDGLTLQYVDCPAWSGAVPAHTVCRGYVDGVVGRVEVDLVAGEGEAVEFDAWLADGVVATKRLVDEIERRGYADVDCGPTAAYPARVGARIVCRAEEDGAPAYVVATVRDSRGAVEIEEY